MSSEKKSFDITLSIYSTKFLYSLFGGIPLLIIILAPILFLIAFATVEKFEDLLSTPSPFMKIYKEVGSKYSIPWTVIQAYHEDDPSYTDDQFVMGSKQVIGKVVDTAKAVKNKVESTITDEKNQPKQKTTTSKIDVASIKKKIFQYGEQISKEKILQEKKPPSTCMKVINNPKVTGSKNGLLEKYSSISCAIYTMKNKNWAQTNKIITSANNYMFPPTKTKKGK